MAQEGKSSNIKISDQIARIPKLLAALKLELQEAAWTNIGPARTADTLDLMDGLIDDLTARADAAAIPAYGLWNQAFIEYAELRNLLDVVFSKLDNRARTALEKVCWDFHLADAALRKQRDLEVLIHKKTDRLFGRGAYDDSSVGSLTLSTQA